MEDISTIIFYAFRYALGRMTYAVSDVARFIRMNTHLIETRDIQQMIYEITEYEKKRWLGMGCDERTWLTLREFLKETLEGREDVK